MVSIFGVEQIYFTICWKLCQRSQLKNFARKTLYMAHRSTSYKYGVGCGGGRVDAAAAETGLTEKMPV